MPHNTTCVTFPAGFSAPAFNNHNTIHKLIVIFDSLIYFDAQNGAVMLLALITAIFIIQASTDIN